MNFIELKEIVEKRLPMCGMKIRPDALAHIASLSRGLPHNAHLFGQQSAKKTLESRNLTIDINHVEDAIGSERKYHYRFVEPTMQPFILMQALRSNLITRQRVNDLIATHYEPRLSSDF
jgi:hypothetical protein